jgi:hypothetical protein
MSISLVVCIALILMAIMVFGWNKDVINGHRDGNVTRLICFAVCMFLLAGALVAFALFVTGH